jgi:hypothetical protein
MIQLFGYNPDPIGAANLRARVGQHNLVLPSSVQDVDVYLWQPLLKVKPSWHRGAQGIGDCVSWGGELACTMSIALQCVQGKAQWIEEVATESIYGGRAG